MDRRSLIGAGCLVSMLPCAAGRARGDQAKSAAQFLNKTPRGKYPSPVFIRDAIQLHFGAALQDKRKLFEGWDDQIVAHGMAPNPVGKSDLISFYTAVFSEFPDFRLVDDTLLVAGDMAAHRYHALGTHSGGSSPTRAQIMFRGQTIYKLNSQGRVTWRVSNHDHQFREEQLQHFRSPGRRLSGRSWAPDPFAVSARELSQQSVKESERELAIRRKFAALDFQSSNALTRHEAWRHFAETTRVSGLDQEFPLGTKTIRDLRDRTQVWADALPDLNYQTLELIVCGDFVARSYIATGTHSNRDLYGRKASGKKIFLREQAVYQLDPSNLVVAMWINHDHNLLSQQFSES